MNVLKWKNINGILFHMQTIYIYIHTNVIIDFAKAFDLVNRNILFFKLIKAGFRGKVIDTLHSLYRKTVFRVKCKGLLSPPIRDNYVVNQRGNASPMLFRQCMADLGDYLTKHYGLCIADDIIVHLLWAYDLVLISDSENGLQKQVNGLLIFSCDQAALQMVFSVCPSVCLSVCQSVCHTFLTMFPSSYHHKIFRSYYQWPT